MGSFTALTPYSDPGSLLGGFREHQVVLKNLQADAFRSASQKQDTGQDARANSGADVDNVHAQSATLEQSPRVQNIKTNTINAVTATNANAASFNVNYLQNYLTGASAADFLARGAANVAQDQSTDQGASAMGVDFDGVVSDALNDLDQTVSVTQLLDVDLSATVTATTSATDQAHAFNQSRFRNIDALVEDSSAQAIFTTGQSQGKFDDPATQIALAGDGDASNTLTQSADIDQGSLLGGITVDLDGAFNLSRTESATLTPRSTDLAATVNRDTAITSSAASQEQALVQSVAGGVDADGQITENAGTAQNQASSTATNADETFVRNRLEITI